MGSRHKPKGGASTGSVYDVVVVGAGIEGSSAAYHLAKQGKKTLLLDQFPLPHSRGSSHGHSRLLRHAYPTHHWYYSKMVDESIPMWRHLEEESKLTIFKPLGVLSVSLDPRHMEPVEKAMAQAEVDYRKLDASQLRSEFPMIKVNDDSVAMVEDHGGMVLADKALQAFQLVYQKYGGVVHDGEKVVDIIPGDVATVRTTSGEYKTRSVVITAGPWTSGLLKPLGLPLPLQPLRVGVFYWREKTPGMFSADRFPVLRFINAIDNQHNLYGCPTHEYPSMVKLCIHAGTVVGPEIRDQDSDDSDVRVLSEFIRDHIPDLEDKPSIIDKCYYTMTPDVDYVMDTHPRWGNIVIGAGFSGHGFKLAPVIGKILSELATCQKSSRDMRPFSIDRFKQVSPKASL